ncbi:hypothetical protein AVEN_190639-1 [Araneus ventricosus]|uniref:Uncharacterized protein n=1 Tax=Araneus ventricosus TaxID=182803 RepID=A0A4Y2I2K1_ARAVE|nr:hypothetical protein AVEN_190639-1 [Araneus ventricosus]
MEEVIYLESSIADFSTNVFGLIDSVVGARMKADYSGVSGIQGVDSGELDMTGLRASNLAKSKFVSVVNDQSAISESEFKVIAIFPDGIFEVGCRKEAFSFQIV